MNKEYKRNCPKCGKEIIYSLQSSYCHAKKRNTKCKSCEFSDPEIRLKKSKSHIGNKSGFEGKSHKEESKLKMSEWHKKKVVSDVTKNKISNRIVTQNTKTKMSVVTKNHWKDPKIRQKMVGGSKWINVKVDKGQLEMIKCWNGIGFRFIPNYQIKTNQDLFYIDGYDKEKGVVLEYDTKYHKRQKEKDLIRQQRIIDILKPKKFWRYDVTNKQFRDVLMKH